MYQAVVVEKAQSALGPCRQMGGGGRGNGLGWQCRILLLDPLRWGRYFPTCFTVVSMRVYTSLRACSGLKAAQSRAMCSRLVWCGGVMKLRSVFVFVFGCASILLSFLYTICGVCLQYFFWCCVLYNRVVFCAPGICRERRKKSEWRGRGTRTGNRSVDHASTYHLVGGVRSVHPTRGSLYIS